MPAEPPIDRTTTTLDMTIAICTWNRAALLRQTLSSMQQLVIPQGVSWEVLVVNNNCTDETCDVIKEFLGKLPIREYFEPQPGKSYALNSGTRAAKGNILLWTDDDVLVQPNWLAAYFDAFQRHPEAQFCGGPVEPWFEVDPPAWLEQAWPLVHHAFAVIDYSDQEIPLSPKTMPFGVNWAIRREKQLAFMYDTRLGPRPDSTLRGEETTLIRQLFADEVPGVWVPSARMKHFVPKNRMTLAYLKGFYYGQGEGATRMKHLGLRDKKVPARWRVLAASLKHFVLYQIKRFGKVKSWIPHFISYNHGFGVLHETSTSQSEAMPTFDSPGNRKTSSLDA